MSELINILFKYYLTNPLIIFILILGIISIFFKPQIIGWFGEYWTKKALKKLPQNRYKIINDVWIRTNDTTHQIDHIVISVYGIFCIETKQYHGFITGRKYDKYWVRHLGKKKYYYTNPIRQNYGHVKSLAELLNLPEEKIYNIVCIPSEVTLKIQQDGEVVGYKSIVKKILSYQEIVIDDVEEIVGIIIKNNITDKKIKRNHIKNIRKNILDKDHNKCPKCGGQLVKRVGKYGNFIGCSNYPRCKYAIYK